MSDFCVEEERKEGRQTRMVRERERGRGRSGEERRRARDNEISLLRPQINP
jgi:hypothetical protein